MKIKFGQVDDDMIKMQSQPYDGGDVECVGWVCWDDMLANPRPGVLVAPAFGGLGEFAKQQAQRLAEMGYFAFCVDYYGGGKFTESNEEASQLMGQLNSEREKLASRMAAALDKLKSFVQVNPQNTGAIGYCFGGKAVLDLARSGAELEATVAFHGVLDAPSSKRTKMKSSVLILHGWDDPLATPDNVLELSQELDEICNDWQLLAFGHTSHAFTNPQANMPEVGMAFEGRSSSRAWEAMTRFLAEKFER